MVISVFVGARWDSNYKHYDAVVVARRDGVEHRMYSAPCANRDEALAYSLKAAQNLFPGLPVDWFQHM